MTLFASRLISKNLQQVLIEISTRRLVMKSMRHDSRCLNWLLFGDSRSVQPRTDNFTRVERTKKNWSRGRWKIIELRNSISKISNSFKACNLNNMLQINILIKQNFTILNLARLERECQSIHVQFGWKLARDRYDNDMNLIQKNPLRLIICTHAVVCVLVVSRFDKIINCFWPLGMVWEVNDQFLILAFKDQTIPDDSKRKTNYGEIIYEMFAFNSTAEHEKWIINNP